MGCPGEDEMLRFARGSLGGEPERAMHEHVATCSDCRRVVAELASNLSVSVSLDSAATPQTSTLRSDAEQKTRTDPPSALPENLTALGRYQLLSVLGAGGMGVVYAAFDPQLNRQVAVKLVRSSGGPEDSVKSRARLLREAQAMAQLSHPNVVHVYDAGTHAEQVFVAMEFVPGKNLRQWLKEHQPKWRDVLRIYLAAGEGLAAAHAAGLVHRDFKPDNVLIGADDRARVTDFGLARIESLWEPPDLSTPNAGPRRPPTMTEAGTVMGTPAYMPPEQLRGLPTDARSDQFSYCVALYEALYCERPFRMSSIEAETRPVRSSAALPLPAGVTAALERGLSARPEDRFATMRELLDALRAGVEAFEAPVKRARAPRLALAAMLAVLGAAGAMAALRLLDAPHDAPLAPVVVEKPTAPKPEVVQAPPLVEPAPIPPVEQPEEAKPSPRKPPARAHAKPAAPGKLKDGEPAPSKDGLVGDPWSGN